MRPIVLTCLRASSVSLLALVSACAVGPQFHAPKLPDAGGYAPGPDAAPTEAAAGVAQSFQPGVAPADAWWTAFGSSEIDALVEQALKSNPDLAAAKATLRSAEELLKAQRLAPLPTLDASYTSQRSRDSGALSPTLANNQQTYSLHEAQLSAAYTLDIWGGMRRNIEQQKATEQGVYFQTRAAREALIANVVTTAVQTAALKDQLDDAMRAAEASKVSLDLARRQRELGALGEADVLLFETTYAQDLQALGAAKHNLFVSESLLSTLVGLPPSIKPAYPASVAKIGLPADLPYVAPADLIRRRADVRLAESNLHAASAAVGVAIAARLPSLTLSADTGGASQSLSHMFDNGNNFWSISGGITQPIIESVALAHMQASAEASFDAAKGQYRSAVLSALRDVAGTLDALYADAGGLKAALIAKAAADKALVFAQKQVEVGDGGTLTLLAAQHAAAQADQAASVAQAQRYSDTVALFLALGGTPDVVKKK